MIPPPGLASDAVFNNVDLVSHIVSFTIELSAKLAADSSLDVENCKHAFMRETFVKKGLFF